MGRTPGIAGSCALRSQRTDGVWCPPPVSRWRAEPVSPQRSWVLSLGDTRCQAGRSSAAVIGTLRLGGEPAGPRPVHSSCRHRAGASAPVRRRHLDFREETPVSSNAVAFDLVRRESVWQRAGPSEGVSPRTNPRRIPGLPGAGRTQDRSGDPRPGSTGDSGEGRPAGATLGLHRT